MEPQNRSSSSTDPSASLEHVYSVPGLVAFWDFVQREDGVGGSGRFVSRLADGSTGYPLDPVNISRMFWHEGRVVTLDDFPLLGTGPFGQAVGVGFNSTDTLLPALMVARREMHDTPLDIKGPGASVSMVIWLSYISGNHGIAGIWHEGTDTCRQEKKPVVIEEGRRQFGMFGGLWANHGAPAAHVSENGRGSFGDRFARHLAANAATMPTSPPALKGTAPQLNWTAIGFTFDSQTGEVIAWCDGRADELWIDDPAGHPYYKPCAEAWRQTWLAKEPQLAGDRVGHYPEDQYYSPPETQPLGEECVATSPSSTTVIRTYPFTRVRETWSVDAAGNRVEAVERTLLSLKVNPYYFGRSIYSPQTIAEGGPFTIGRVIHSNREPGVNAWIGGVAVFNRALDAGEMKRLAACSGFPRNFGLTFSPCVP